ncbi:MAG TPA: hypothetical protein VEJ23_05065, partial [Solirubrobacteraceae bacterium]|nr:hypothetical protein [Solirubrobacteraceae bacterium]
MTVTAQETRKLQIVQSARSKRARFRDEHITMAHGAGGRSSQSLIEGLLVPTLASYAASSSKRGADWAAEPLGE